VPRAQIRYPIAADDLLLWSARAEAPRRLPERIVIIDEGDRVAPEFAAIESALLL
jgi:hypothetical protein